MRKLWLVSFAAVLLLAGATPKAALYIHQATGARVPQIFLTSDQCMACHDQLSTRTGDDISIGTDWRGSIMANSSRDPYWHAAVRREIMDHPAASDEIQDECTRCHMPMSNVVERALGGRGRAFDHLPINDADDPIDDLAADGVSCTLCHQIQAENLGRPESFSGGFVIDTVLRNVEHRRFAFGPFVVDTGRITIMRSATHFRPSEGLHVQTSEFCGTCHVLYTNIRNGSDRVIGKFPEQTPNLEWEHSAYRGRQTCQQCHMPAVDDSVAITSVMGQPRPELSQHTFIGGNFFMLRMLAKYRQDLGVLALPEELESIRHLTEQFLQNNTARIRVASPGVRDGRIEADVTVENLTGHKFPTAYPSRRAWLHVTVRDQRGTIVFESGRLRSNGSIVGNDNDADPARFEPHYDRIESPDQVQIYEPIMVDTAGRVTTGLLSAIRYAKDNRVLPDGFDKATAIPDIAVQGAAARDANFVGGRDRVRYRIPVRAADGPFVVEAKLWYQPIGFRWAHNLEPYDAFEPQRFLRWYEAMSDVTGIVITQTSLTVR